MWMDNYMKHGPVDAINNKDAPCGWMDRATPGPAVRGGPDILSWDPAAQDGRDPQYAKPITNFMRSAVAKSAYTKLAEIPADFDRFLPGTAVCTEETKVKLRSLFEDRRTDPGVGKFIRTLSHLSGYELYRKIKMKLLYSIGQLKMVTETANCGAPFLQSDIGGTNTYDILELAVWGHFMVEADPAGLVDLSSNTFWNHNVANDLTKPAHHLRHISAVCNQQVKRCKAKKHTSGFDNGATFRIENSEKCHGFFVCEGGQAFQCRNPSKFSKRCKSTPFWGSGKTPCPSAEEGFYNVCADF
jgi:hypothetical protein